MDRSQSPMSTCQRKGTEDAMGDERERRTGLRRRPAVRDSHSVAIAASDLAMLERRTGKRKRDEGDAEKELKAVLKKPLMMKKVISKKLLEKKEDDISDEDYSDDDEEEELLQMKLKVVLEPPSMKNVIWNKPLEKKEGDVSNKDYSDGNEKKEPLQKKPQVFNPFLMRQLIQMESKVVPRPPLMKNVIWKKPLEKKEGDISDEDYSDDDEEEELLQMKPKVVLNSP